MSCYAKYLVQKLKEVTNCTSIVVKHALVDAKGHIEWMTNSKQMYRKCSLIGYRGDIRVPVYYVSSTYLVYGDAIAFDDNWKSYDMEVFSSDDPATYDVPMLESFFFQMMTITEKQHVYIHGKILFKKGSAYQHLMQAELTCS